MEAVTSRMLHIDPPSPPPLLVVKYAVSYSFENFNLCAEGREWELVLAMEMNSSICEEIYSAVNSESGTIHCLPVSLL